VLAAGSGSRDSAWCYPRVAGRKRRRGWAYPPRRLANSVDLFVVPEEDEESEEPKESQEERQERRMCDTRTVVFAVRASGMCAG
jgi:hypothetical protein